MSELVLKNTKKGFVKNLFNKIFASSDDVYDKFNDRVQKAAEYTLRKKGGVREAEDYLLMGDWTKYADAKYLETAPQAFLEIPKDMLVLPTYDSLLPDQQRSNPALMAFRHIDERLDRDILDDVHASALKYKKKTRLYGYSALAFSAIFPLITMPWPSFSIGGEYSKYLTASEASYQYLIGLAAFGAQFAVGLGIGAFLVGLGAFGVAALMRKVEKLAYDFTFYNRLNSSWHQLKHKLTYNQSLPTRQGRTAAKENEHQYVQQTAQYHNAVKYAVTALKDDTLLKIGVCTGMMSDKGINYMPMANNDAMIDITSFRQHGIVIGATGVGKTETVLAPLALEYVKACQDSGRKLGMLLMDGKGVFGNQFVSYLPEELRQDVYVCGSGDTGFGIDIMKGLSPSEFADQFQSVAMSMSKNTENLKWLAGAADRLRDAAEILAFIEASPKKLDISEFWKDRPYTYYSMFGAITLATEVDLRKAVTSKILENAEKYPVAVVIAARNFASFEKLASETQTSYTSNILDISSKITGVLAERFAYGSESAGVKYVSLEDLDRGKIISMSISAADDNAGAIIINNMIKSIAYTLAQRRDTKANRAREKLSRIDEQIGRKNIKLGKIEADLTRMRSKVTSNVEGDYEEVINYLNQNYPRKHSEAQWVSYKKLEVLNFFIDKIDDIQRQISRFTPEVIAIAEQTRTLREKAKKNDPSCDVRSIKSEGYLALEKDRDATSESSVLILIDEAHFYLTSGNSITSDTFFLSIARSTGRTVLCATQSYEAIYSRMPEHDAASLLTNFGTKIFMKTDDPRTQDAIIRAFGSSKFESVLSPNAYANYPRLLNSRRDEKPNRHHFSSTEGACWNLDMNSSLSYGNWIHVDMQEYDAGERANVNAVQHENNVAGAKNETHNRMVSKQAYSEEVDKSGVEQNIIRPEDISNLGYGEAFAIYTRANRKVLDKIRVKPMN